MVRHRGGDLDGGRGYVALAFGLPGLTVGIVGCTGRRRGNPVAAGGSILLGGLGCVLPPAPLDLLRDELDVQLGDRHVDPGTGIASATGTMRNKGPDVATFVLAFEVRDRTSDSPCDGGFSGDLVPGAGYQPTWPAAARRRCGTSASG